MERVVAFETLVVDGGGVERDESDDDIEEEGDDEDMSTGAMGDAVGVETAMVCPAIGVYSCISSWWLGGLLGVRNADQVDMVMVMTQGRRARHCCRGGGGRGGVMGQQWQQQQIE